jgi:tripartite-type tricarboxylate transporter receptor subunit TctC
MNARIARLGFFLALAIAILPAATQAQGYPQRSVKVVLPYPAGGPTDIVARIVAQKLSDSLQQPFVVENRPGATGTMGTDAVAKARPDGYTLLVNASVQVIYPNLFPAIAFDPMKDFAPVGVLAKGPLALVVNPGLPVKSVPELVALAKGSPGKLTFASSGNGAATHLAAEAFRLAAGVDIRHVAYKGSAPALSDVAAGHVDLMFDSVASSGALVRGGKLRALAVTSARRSGALPDLPTVAESVSGYDMGTWYGLWAPAGTSPEVVKLLSQHVNQALRSPEAQDRLKGLGLEANADTPEAFAAFLRAEQKKWGDVVRKAGVKPE